MSSLTRTENRSAALTVAESEFQRLATRLVPATVDEAMSVIKFMFKVLPLPATDEDDASVDIMIATYQIAVRDQPRWALTQARDAFIRGEVDGHRSSFCPNPAEFGREVTRIVDRARIAASRAKRMAEEDRRLRDESEPSGPISEATRARIAAFLAKSGAVSAELSRDLARRPEPQAARSGHMARVAAATAAKRAAREEARPE